MSSSDSDSDGVTPGGVWPASLAVGQTKDLAWFYLYVPPTAKLSPPWRISPTDSPPLVHRRPTRNSAATPALLQQEGPPPLLVRQELRRATLCHRPPSLSHATDEASPIRPTPKTQLLPVTTSHEHHHRLRDEFQRLLSEELAEEADLKLEDIVHDHYQHRNF
ncbi:hypothetical protein ZWY2020_050290 [Hordeum vulgare]|nr:hypothetical protein ZWY2020_050290 [Hordeum vulgare]